MTVSKLADAEGQPPETTAPGPQPAEARANLYVARMLQQRFASDLKGYGILDFHGD